MDKPVQEGDNYSIKKLLFYRAIPPYVPEVSDVKNLFNCMDCGDRFFFDTSYEQHINRKSLKITYNCRYCQALPRKTFYNRCKFLSHIRSHSYKTATINVSDLKIEPLPSEFFIKPKAKSPTVAPIPSTITCIECNESISITDSNDTPNRHRASHYMKFALGSTVFACPICLATLPNVCALKAHLRIHLRIPPFVCPECGVYLLRCHINYPYNHYCEGFNMMRATARLKCNISKCQLFHPNEFRTHMKTEHVKKVYKCPFCLTACFSEATINRHVSLAHHIQPTITRTINIFYQCELCPGRLVLQSHLDSHMSSHFHNHVYPCWICGIILDNVVNVLEHYINHHKNNDEFKVIYQSLRKNVPEKEIKKVYRVVKKCDQCSRTFTYKCSYDQINILPNVCPYKCTTLEDRSQDTPNNIMLINNELQTEANIPNNFIVTDLTERHSNTKTSTQIMCTLCNIKISQEWEAVKAHYAVSHKEHKCVDVKISLTKIEPKDLILKRQQQPNDEKRKRPRRKTCKKLTKNEQAVLVSTTPHESKLICNICDEVFSTKGQLAIHLKEHRDPLMAYQCLECGKSFVVKPSFTMHLMLEHGITDVDHYIEEKKCYNANALTLNQQNDDANDIPLKENQCKICREQFDNADDLEKHFRVHGMAFLMKNSQIKPVAS